MKTLKLAALGIVLFLSITAKAQVSVNVNVGSPPAWGPQGYEHDRYYYLPDVEAYYDVQTAMFIYMVDGRWEHHAHLAGQYRDYDLYGGYKVVMTDYRGDRPYDNFKEYHSRYAKGYRGAPQKTIRERPARGNEGRPAENHRNAPAQNHPTAHRPAESPPAANRPAQGHPNNTQGHNAKAVKHAPQKAAPHGNEKEGNKGDGHGEGKGK